MFEPFKAAQDSRHGGFETACAELRRGRKTSHWIWYIFPQLAGLGSSGMARKFGLADVHAAADYLADPLLRARLAAATNIVAEQLRHGVALRELMGGQLDALKLVSSLTLFEAAAARGREGNDTVEIAAFHGACRAVLAAAKEQGFERCAFTLGRLDGASGTPV